MHPGTESRALRPVLAGAAVEDEVLAAAGQAIGQALQRVRDLDLAGVAMTLPTVEQLIIDGLTGQYASQEQFERYLNKGLERLLSEAVFTFSYQFFPLGMPSSCSSSARSGNCVRAPSSRRCWPKAPRVRAWPAVWKWARYPA